MCTIDNIRVELCYVRGYHEYQRPTPAAGGPNRANRLGSSPSLQCTLTANHRFQTIMLVAGVIHFS
jgi:hypothetical protein